MTKTTVSQFASLLRLALEHPINGKYDAVRMHQAAEALIDLREQFHDRDGRADLSGRSFAYREALGQALAEAGVSKSDRSRVMAALRFHTGNLLRERYDAETLASYGMHAEGPGRRQRETRQADSKIARAARYRGISLTDTSDVLEALKSALNLLNNVEPGRLKKAEQAEFAAYADAILMRAKALKR